MKRYILGLDLVNNEQLIQEYEAYHHQIWPEIKESILKSGILAMEIYRFDNRLFMIMEVNDDFTFERKNELDASNQKVQDWESLMWKYQQAIPGTPEGEKWVLMNKIFEL